MKKISCGGFSIDGTTITETDGVLSAIGGSSGGGIVFCN